MGEKERERGTGDRKREIERGEGRKVEGETRWERWRRIKVGGRVREGKR